MAKILMPVRRWLVAGAVQRLITRINGSRREETKLAL